MKRLGLKHLRFEELSVKGLQTLTRGRRNASSFKARFWGGLNGTLTSLYYTASSHLEG